MAAYVTRLRTLRANLSRLHNFSLLGGEEANTRPGEFPGIPAKTPLDPGKIVLICRGQMDGPALYGCLRETYHLQPEMCGPSYVLCMTTIADTDEGFGRLAEAMEEIDKIVYAGTQEKEKQAIEGYEKREENGFSFAKTTLPPVACPIYEAAEAFREAVPLEEANGRVAAAYVLLYPPDAPLIIPGEVFTAEKIREIQEYLRLGFSVPGIETGERVWVTYAD